MSNLIECLNVSKSYGRQAVLSNISFEIKAGKPIALVGPNGAGKSTLFSLLSGYIQPNLGSIKVLGHAVGSPELIGRIGVLPQDALLDPNLTILQQLTFLARLQGFSAGNSAAEAERVLMLMQLLDSRDQKVTELSHGMKKRVSIAQALMGQPELVLLDEPTAGLDPENARNIRQQINALSGDVTFLISSHNLDELERLCERVLYLEKGELRSDTFVASSADIEEQRYLTVRLENSNYDINEKIAALDAVVDVNTNDNDEIIIRYNYLQNTVLDQQILQLLAENNAAYRQLTQGQSLENKLFMR